MNITIHPHAQARLVERGATVEEVIATVEGGKAAQADFDRTRFRRRFPFNAEWREKTYATKQIDAIAVQTESEEWLVITVIVKFF
ncbi:hypothetical protein [Phormidesmis priestleyi]